LPGINATICDGMGLLPMGRRRPHLQDGVNR
jgi:hypothetical protein